MREVLYTSPFVPPEWISAHGLRPVRWTPRGAPADGSPSHRAGTCAFAGGFTEEVAAADAAGVVLTTGCDQMRRAADALENATDIPVFLLDVPATWQTSAAYLLYRTELERLGRFLVEVGGRAPTLEDLAAHLLREDERERGEARAGDHPPARGIPIALVGGPLAAADRSLVTSLERAGGCIVLDGTEEGERAQRGRLDRRRVGEDPLGALADATFGTIPDAFRRPNSLLYEWLGRRLAESEARGVVLLRYAWCDLWHAETARLQEWLPVPLLELDLTGQPADGRNEVRIQAFLEGLRP